MKHKAVILTKVSIFFIALLCMVMRRHNFVFHLYDDKKHDGAFTKHVIEELTSFFPSAIFLVKSDNCSFQYKCGKVLHSWRTLAEELQKIFVYYRVSRHRKGLDDAISTFGVKNPLKRFVIWGKWGDFEFDSSYGIFDRVEHTDKLNWLYYHIDVDELRQKR